MTILTEMNGPVASVRLNRPELHNALNDQVGAALTATFERLGSDPQVRVIVLSGAGKSFCAGADLDWMRRAGTQPEAANRADALGLARMFATIDACPKPVIGLVQGAAIGGGVGLCAVCDIVLATPDAVFGLSEVHLGLIPATISPFVVSRIGVAQARRYMLSGERFDAATAHRIGLIHEIVEDPASSSGPLIDALLLGGPEAQADVKRLISEVAHQPLSEALSEMTADRIARRRASDEGREGLSAFLEKRKPEWSGVPSPVPSPQPSPQSGEGEGG